MYQPSSSLCIYHLQVYPYVYLSPFSQMTEKETGLNSSTAKLGFEASSDPRPFCALLSRFASFMREYVPHFEQHFPRCDALTTGIALIWNACWNSHSQAPPRPREAGAPGRPRGGGVCVLAASAGNAHHRSLNVIVFDESRGSMRCRSCPSCLYTQLESAAPGKPKQRLLHLLLHC